MSTFEFIDMSDCPSYYNQPSYYGQLYYNNIPILSVLILQTEGWS